MGIRVNLDPSLTLRMTNWMRLVILRTEVACPELAEGKNLGFGLLPLCEGGWGDLGLW